MPSSKITQRYSARQRRLLLSEEIEDSMRSSRMVGGVMLFLIVGFAATIAIFLYLR
jgi:hypothetical protein